MNQASEDPATGIADDSIADIAGLIIAREKTLHDATRYLLQVLECGVDGANGLFVPFWNSKPQNVIDMLQKYCIELMDADVLNADEKMDAKDVAKELFFCVRDIDQNSILSTGKKLIVWSAIRAAFELGALFNAPEKAKMKIAEFHLSKSRVANRIGVANRQAKASKWHEIALASAIINRTKNAKLSQSALAEKIEDEWPDLPKPSYESLKKFIGLCEKDGRLPPRKKN